MAAASARAAGWGVLAVLVVFTIVRLVQPAGSRAVVYAVALTPLCYTAAWPVAVAATWRRQRAMALVAGALIVIQILLVIPARHPWETAAAATGAWRLSLLDANVRYTNDDLGDIGRQVAADRPDVVALEEVSTRNVGSFAHYVAGYPWRFVHPTGSSTGFGIWSVVPLRDAHIVTGPGAAVVAATLLPPGKPPIHMFVVHTVAPVGRGQYAVWSAQLRALGSDIRRTARPLIVVGDLNATSDMRQFQQATDHLEDAAVQQGEGWRPTWPRDWSLVPAFLRIDHVLYSSQLTVTSYRLGSDAGSDHRPILATLGTSGG